MKKHLFRAAEIIGVMLPITIFATSVASAQVPSIISDKSQLGSGLLCPIISVMFVILIAISVIMVLWAAYLYVTAGDDTEKVHKATKTITYAAVAIVVALIAYGFPSLIASIFGQTSSNLFQCSGGGGGGGTPAGSSGLISS